jgi:hypothetical protein
MGRRPPASALAIGVVASTVLALTVGASLLPAGGAPSNPKANRFGPSGVHTADPLASREQAARARAQAATAAAGDTASVPGPSVAGSGGCRDDDGGNVRVNQDCTNQSDAPFLGRGQGQNETAIAVSPRNAGHLVAAQNDYRRGDGACGADWSHDGGRHWGSELAPLGFTAPGFTGARHYWDASGDPSVAFDSSGEAYLFCLAFNRGAPTSDVNVAASGLFLFRSADGGASWNFPGSAVKQSDGTGADGIGLLDKPYMAVDTGKGSRFRDRIYVAWAEYNVDFTADPIGFAWSDDHGASWNLVPAISGTSAQLCPVTFDGSPAGTCNANQFPQPFTAPNGDVYVVFQNFNNAVAAGGDNHNQVLIVKSTDGGASFTGTTTPVAELPSVSDENPRTQLADQWWQWAARNPKGGVTVAYYDRKYGDAQQTGFMDITMRRGNGSHVRVTNRSLPPTQEFPEAGASTGVFVGDYMGLAVGADGRAHPIWTDTRNPVFSPSTGGDVRELVKAGQGTDIYTRSLPG